MFNKDPEKDPEKIKNRQSAMNNIKTEIKNILEGTNRRVTETEKWISELEDRMVEITEAEQNKEKRMKINGDSLRDFKDTVNAPKLEL